MSNEQSLPKNLIAAHPVQGSQADESSEDACSPATPKKAKERLRYDLSEAKQEGRRLTKDALFYVYGREGESQRRNSGVTAARACILLYLYLSFSIKMNNF